MELKMGHPLRTKLHSAGQEYWFQSHIDVGSDAITD